MARSDNRLRRLSREIAIETGDFDALDRAGIAPDLAFKQRGLRRISEVVNNNPRILSRLKNAGPATVRKVAENLGIDLDTPDVSRIEALESRFDKLQPKEVDVVEKQRQKLLKESIEQQLIDQEGSQISEQANQLIQGSAPQPTEGAQQPQGRQSVINSLSSLLTGPVGGAAQIAKGVVNKLSNIQEDEQIKTNLKKQPTNQLEAIKQEFNTVKRSTSLSARELDQYVKSRIQSEAIRQLEISGHALTDANIENATQQLLQQYGEIK